MVNELTTMEKMRGLPWIVAHNGLNTVFFALTFAGSVFVLFLNELGLDNARIGFLLALIPFCGIVSLFVAPFTARFGYKRTFLTFYSLRKVTFACMLLTPWVLSQYGIKGTFIYVSVLIFFFAIFRSIAETAVFPWNQEVIPNSMRGKLSGISTLVSTTSNILTILLASFIIGHFTEWRLGRYMFLIAFGLVFGVMGVCCYGFVPGGKPRKDFHGGARHFRSMLLTFTDKNFRLYLTGFGLAFIGISVFAFVPLFLKEKVGMNSGMIVFLDIGALLGGLISCYLWGWASDRYGSKPVMLSGLSLLLFIPIFWFLIPRQIEWIRTLALCIVFIYGIVNMGWAIGWQRYLFVSAVPDEKRTTYMAVFYAWMGLTGGLGPLMAGLLLRVCNRLDGQIWIFHYDAFSPLFAAGILFMFTGLIVMSRLRADGAMPVRKFIGMFFHGNPVLALESLVRYGWAGDEISRVSLLERLSSSKNPLSKNELIEALNDPSFYVRFEAVTAIARMPADPDLVDALLLVLGGDEPDLSLAAAWALGRLGDTSAILPLQETLISEYPLLSAYSARALARLNDRDSIPYITKRFREEPCDKMKLPYASALGALQVEDVLPELFDLLKRMHGQILREEIALAIARVYGYERDYMYLWRSSRVEMGTCVAKALESVEKEHVQRAYSKERIKSQLSQCILLFAQQNIDDGVTVLADITKEYAEICSSNVGKTILKRCSEELYTFKSSRTEYILLSVHVLSHPQNK